MTRTYTAWQTACAGYRSVFVLLTSVLTVMPFVFSAYPLAAETNGNAPQAALCLQCWVHPERVPSRCDGLEKSSRAIPGGCTRRMDMGAGTH